MVRGIASLIVSIALFLGSNEARSNDGPIVVGGGAGESEFSMAFARTNLYSILNDCLTFSCGLDSDAAKRLSIVLTKSRTPPVAFFKNSANMAGQLYSVQNSGASVWFNQDLLWLDSSHTIPYGVSEAVGLWSEILAIDEAVSNQDLALLKSRLKSALQVERQGQSFDDHGEFEILLWKYSDSLDRLFVTSPALDVIELNDALKSQLSCQSVASLKIYSPTWVSATEVPEGNPEKIIFKLSFGAKWTCNGTNHNGSGFALVSARRNSSNILEFDPQSVEVEVGEQ